MGTDANGDGVVYDRNINGTNSGVDNSSSTATAGAEGGETNE